MFEVRLSEVISSIVEKIHKPTYGQGPSRGIIVRCKVSVSHNRKKTCETRLVDFVVCGNRKVWCSIQDRRLNKQLTWINTANHDSCWKSDGIDSVLSNLYFELCKLVNPSVAPKNLSQYSCIGFLSEPWQECLVHWEQVSEYKYKLNKLEIL